MRSIPTIVFLACLAPLAPGQDTTPVLPSKPVLTLAAAKRICAAAADYARAKGGGTSAIAVVDDGGSVLVLERLDGTFAAAAQVCIGKARMAALFQKPTAFFEDLIKKGRTPMLALEQFGFAPLQGGVPIEVGGQVVGAIGVSGAKSAPADEEVALAGVAALGSMPGTCFDVRHFAAMAVDASFARGQPLLENGSFKIHTSRREQAGEAEVHAHETDILYVQGGEATLVTGGTLVGGRETAPGEVRGPSIEGGTSRTIAKGDVVVVPKGTPHWFKSVAGPVTYYVVKVVGQP